VQSSARFIHDPNLMRRALKYCLGAKRYLKTGAQANRTLDRGTILAAGAEDGHPAAVS